METTGAAPMVQSAPAPTPTAPSSERSFSSDKIITGIVTGIAQGFFIGVGIILAFRAMKKSMVVKEKSSEQTMSSMNGYPAMMPPMVDRYGRPMPMPMPRNPRNPYGNYSGADANKFDLDSWLKEGNGLGNNIPD